jgi:simple sugar transport system ATP-binding protein
MLKSQYAVDMKDIVKEFGEVVASDHVNFIVKSGEIHALLGENGAGKSTIMSMLSGIYKADSGSISIYGNDVEFVHQKNRWNLDRDGSPKF